MAVLSEHINALQELNTVRGHDKAAQLAQELRRAYGKRHFRAFLAGHSGCGKSTELSRPGREVSEQYRPGDPF